MRPDTLRRTLYSFLGAVLLIVGTLSSVQAEDVQIEFNGLDLKGYLEVAQGKSLTNDGVVIIVHGTLSHGNTVYISNLQQELKASGVNSLAITLSLGLDQREGVFNCTLEQNHRHSDGAEEIGAWVKWLSEKGVNKISLLGIERGGNQAALYIQEQLKTLQAEKAAAEKAKKRKRRRRRREPVKTYVADLNKLILLMPVDISPVQAYNDFASQFKADLGKYLVEAQKFAEKLREQELLENTPFLACGQARVTVGAFIDYYLPKDEHSLFRYISAFPMPTLAIVGSQDPQFKKFEAIVSEQLQKGVGQLGVARLAGLNRNLNDLPVDILAQQVVNFINR